MLSILVSSNDTKKLITEILKKDQNIFGAPSKWERFILIYIIFKVLCFAAYVRESSMFGRVLYLSAYGI